MQYNGYLKRVDFAVLDDHNSEDNFKKFDTELSHLGQQLKCAGVPFAGLYPGVSCPYGGTCRAVAHVGAKDHCTKYHPPLCPLKGADMPCSLEQDDIHKVNFAHRQPCKQGGLCELWNDRSHADKYLHPLECRDGLACENTERGHLQAFCHLPLCDDGVKCSKLKTKKCNRRHIVAECPDGTFCPKLGDSDHFVCCKHPHEQVCPHITKQACAGSDSSTRSLCTKAHACEWGEQCTLVDKEEHMRVYFHIARPHCPQGDKCSDTTEGHAGR